MDKMCQGLFREMLWGEPPTTVRLYEHMKNAKKAQQDAESGEIYGSENSNRAISYVTEKKLPKSGSELK